MFAHHLEITVEMHGRPRRHGAALPPVVLAAHEEARLAADRQPRPFLLDADAFRLHGLIPNHDRCRLRIDDFAADDQFRLYIYIIRRVLRDVPCCFNLRFAAALNGESRLLHGDFRAVFIRQNEPHTAVAIRVAEVRDDRLQRRILPPAVAHVACHRATYVNTTEQRLHDWLQQRRAFAVVRQKIHVVHTEERPAGSRVHIREMVHHRGGVAAASAIAVEAFQQRDPTCAVRPETMAVHTELADGGHAANAFPTPFQWPRCVENTRRLADVDALHMAQFE